MSKRCNNAKDGILQKEKKSFYNQNLNFDKSTPKSWELYSEN